MLRGKPLLDSGEEVVPEEGLDLRKPSPTAVTKGKLCSWCGKRSISSPNGLVGSSSWSYCSERCYELFRRAVFKKRSACLWCSNSSSGGNLSSVVNIQSSLDETKFCSEFCLTQFKLKLFCEETTSHLHQIKEKEAGGMIGGCGKDLITPALWLPKDAPPLLSDVQHTATSIRDGPDRTLGFTFQPTWRDQSQLLPSNTSDRSLLTSSDKQALGVPKSLVPMAAQCHVRALPNVKRLRRGHSPLTKTPIPNPPSANRFQSPRPSISPASHTGAQMSLRHDESPSSSTGSRHLTTLPVMDQSYAMRGIPTQTERISIVPIPFPFLFPVLMPTTHTSNPLDPIEDLE